MDLVLFPHGGSGNHGCEAIVRGTVKLLGTRINLYSGHPDQDAKVGLDSICNVQPSTTAIKRFDFRYALAFFRYNLLKDKYAYDELIYRCVVKDAAKSSFYLSIGGDNYCYSGMYFYYLVNRMMDRAGVKRVLWGASVDPEMIDDAMLKDLQGYKSIVARESLTYEALIDKHLSQTVLYPDPAFVLDKKITDLPHNFVVRNTVGVNLSPMVIGCESKSGCTLANYVCLVKHILQNTDMQVALIPHVVWDENDDRKPLKELYERVQVQLGKDVTERRVCMVDDCNCEELKYLISCCRFMIAARTHASIAAYSTQVPTLVVGYSIKARGIAKDIFGTCNNYVIPVQSLKNESDLLDCFEWLRNNEITIREHYKQIMPEYISRAYHLKDVFYERAEENCSCES